MPPFCGLLQNIDWMQTKLEVEFFFRPGIYIFFFFIHRSFIVDPYYSDIQQDFARVKVWLRKCMKANCDGVECHTSGKWMAVIVFGSIHLRERRLPTKWYHHFRLGLSNDLARRAFSFYICHSPTTRVSIRLQSSKQILETYVDTDVYFKSNFVFLFLLLYIFFCFVFWIFWNIFLYIFCGFLF